MTRAQSHLVLWWAPTWNTPQSPLHRLLLHDDPAEVAPRAIDVPDDATALAAFRARAALQRRRPRRRRRSRPRPLEVWSPVRTSGAALDLAAFTRSLDTGWRRTSYSALTSAAHEQSLRLGSEPEVAPEGRRGRPRGVCRGDTPADDAHLRAVTSPWDALPGGPAFGTLVHTVLEELDDPADDDAVRATVAAQVARYAPGTDVDDADRRLLAALATPLGRAGRRRGAARHPGVRPAALSSTSSCRSAGGDEPRAAATWCSADLVPLWREHCPTGPLSSYADALAELPDVPLRGYLTGSIDAVLRVGTAASPRYLVVDYKTNRLGGYDEPLTAWHYRPERAGERDGRRALPVAGAAVRRRAAPLPAVAAARLRPGRAPRRRAVPLPARHVRAGRLDADGSAPGVFSWRPPTGLVTGLSDLLAGSP